MNLKKVKENNAFAYISFAVFSILAFILVTKAIFDFNLGNNKPIKAETVNVKLAK